MPNGILQISIKVQCSCGNIEELVYTIDSDFEKIRNSKLWDDYLCMNCAYMLLDNINWDKVA